MITRSTCSIRTLCIAIALMVASLFAIAAHADEVTSKGTVLRGNITALAGSGITFEPEYGAGALTIKWENIEDIRSAGNFQVLHGDGEELDAPLQGLSDGKLLVGTTPETTTAVAIADIHSGFPIGASGPNWQDRLRSYWRYWDGSLDFAVNVQQATTDSTGFLLGFKTTRRHDPTRFILGADYRFTTQESPTKVVPNPNGPPGSTTTTGGKSTIEDRAFGLIRGEYDFTPRFYGFGSGDATYDAIQKLSIRGVPKAGVGYLFWEEKLDEEKRNFLSGEVGGAWVYESYFTSAHTSNRDYFAIAFGAAAGYHLPFGAHFDWRLDYLPAVDDFTGDFLLRNAFGLTLPIVGPIAAKFALIDEYNAKPANDTDNNSLFITFGLSVLW